MLSSFLKVVLLFLLVRLLWPLFKGFGASLNKLFTTSKNSNSTSKQMQSDYSDLTSYEIEDADFEELKEK